MSLLVSFEHHVLQKYLLKQKNHNGWVVFHYSPAPGELEIMFGTQPEKSTGSSWPLSREQTTTATSRTAPPFKKKNIQDQLSHKKYPHPMLNTRW